MRAALLALLTLVVAAGVARAETVGIDVAVDVADLDPQATGLGIACMVCTVDCETAGGAQVLGIGNTAHPVPATHAYKGTLTVSVPASSAKGTDYLCRMSVSNGAASFVAGTGPDWTIPDENQPFTNMLKGKLPLNKTSAATKCANGAERINGKCPSGNVASTPPGKTCPDGSAMPANGNCGVVGPSIDLGGILKLFTPPPGQPAPVVNAPATKLTVTPCPGGKTRLADGSCPPTSSFTLKRFLLPPPVEAPR